MIHGHSGHNREFPEKNRRKVSIKFKYRIKTKPAGEPVSSGDMQLFIKDVDAVDIPELDRLTKAAREQIELLTGIALINQVWTAYSDILPGRIFELRLGRIVSVASILVFDEDEVSVSVPASDFYIGKGDPRIALKHGKTWPTIGQTSEGFQIEFTAGFGTAGSDVPEDIKAAIKQLTTLYYEYREPIIFDELPTDIKFTLNDIVHNYKVRNI